MEQARRKASCKLCVEQNREIRPKRAPPASTDSTNKSDAEGLEPSAKKQKCKLVNDEYDTVGDEQPAQARKFSCIRKSCSCVGPLLSCAQVDKVTLKQFYYVLKAGKADRAFDLVDGLHLEKSFEIAITASDRMGHLKLSDRIEAIRVSRFPPEQSA